MLVKYIVAGYAFPTVFQLRIVLGCVGAMQGIPRRAIVFLAELVGRSMSLSPYVYGRQAYHVSRENDECKFHIGLLE